MHNQPMIIMHNQSMIIMHNQSMVIMHNQSMITVHNQSMIVTLYPIECMCGAGIHAIYMVHTCCIYAVYNEGHACCMHGACMAVCMLHISVHEPLCVSASRLQFGCGCIFLQLIWLCVLTGIPRVGPTKRDRR